MGDRRHDHKLPESEARGPVGIARANRSYNPRDATAPVPTSKFCTNSGVKSWSNRDSGKILEHLFTEQSPTLPNVFPPNPPPTARKSSLAMHTQNIRK